MLFLLVVFVWLFVYIMYAVMSVVSVFVVLVWILVTNVGGIGLMISSCLVFVFFWGCVGCDVVFFVCLTLICCVIVLLFVVFCLLYY